MDKRHESKLTVRENISSALLSLMKRKNFSDITVSDIVLEAGVARASYYRNFASKEEILKDRVYRMVENIKAELEEEDGDGLTYERTLKLFKYIAGRSSDLESIFKSGVSGVFLDSINEYFENSTFGELKPGLDVWSVYTYAGAFFNILNKWIEGGMEKSPEELAEIFCRLFKQ